jgi:predicted adenylyl cyclase CyaB
VVVDKLRHIFFINNVKFHVDEVKGLGDFVEIEAIGEAGEENKLEQQCRHFMELLHLDNDDLISESYSDLLSNRS